MRYYAAINLKKISFWDDWIEVTRRRLTRQILLPHHKDQGSVFILNQILLRITGFRWDGTGNFYNHSLAT